MPIGSSPVFALDSEAAIHYLAAIIESSEDAIISKSLDGTITSWNKAAERLFGYTAGEIVGRPVAMLAAPGMPDEIPQILDRIRAGHRIELYETVRRRKDGELIHVALSVSPIRDSEGRIIGASKIARDISERRRAEAELARLLAREQQALEDAEQALRVHRELDEKLAGLADASTALLGSLESRQVIPQILALAERLLEADAYAIWRSDGAVWRIVASSNLSKEYANRSISRREETMKLDAPIAVADIQLAEEVANRNDLYQSEGIRSFLAAPMRIHGSNAGTITFYFKAPHPATETELRVATALANLSAAAISTTELYEEQLALRAQAEGGARRARLVAQASGILGASLDYEKTLTDLARLAVPDFADWCSVDLLTEDGQAHRLALHHIDQEKLALAHELRRRYPSQPDSCDPLSVALRTGQAVLESEIPDEMLVRAAKEPEHLELLRSTGIRSVIIAPMVAREKTVGAIIFGISESARRFSEADLAVAQQLATRGALAVDNARLFATAERGRAEAQATAEALRQSNAELEQFAYVSSHDLQEPLRNVASYAQLLEQRYKGKLDADADEFIGFLVDGARRMSALIEDVLRYSRLMRGGTPMLTRVNCEHALSTALLNLRKAVGEKRAAIYHDPLPEVLGHEVHVTQVFQNLISNAIKYSGDRAPEIHIGARLESDRWVLSVSDNGIGIDPQYKDRIFGMFKRLHGRNVPGTGIGLATCKKIVEHHGGRIWVESTEGHGSSFYFTLKAASGLTQSNE